MSWEKRGKQRYYYRKKRVGQQVFSEYAGAQTNGFLAQLEDETERLERQRAREDLAASVENIKALCRLDCQSHEVEKRIRTMISAAYLMSGYHTHRRQWRRWRKK